MQWGICPTMNGTIIVFYLPARTPANVHKRFRKKIYGEDTSSWEGRYRYRRKGILDIINHVKLYKGVVIILPEDVASFLECLKEYGAVVHVREVELTTEDQQTLTVDKN